MRSVAAPWWAQPTEWAAPSPEWPAGALVLPIDCPLVGGTYTVQPWGTAANAAVGPAANVPGYVGMDFASPVQVTGNFTWIVVACAEYVSTANATGFSLEKTGTLGTLEFSVAAGQARFVIDNNPGTVMTGDFTVPTVFVVTRVANQIRSYAAGEFKGTAVTGTRTGAITGANFGRARTALNNPGRTIGELQGVYPVAFSDDDIRVLATNAWQLYEPQRIWIPVATGGGHDASGNLTASAAVVVGTASRSASHAASGALTAGSATVAGSANRVIVHAATGALTAATAAVAGLATRYRTHASAGGLVSGSAVVAGLADVTQVGPSHAAVGDLVAGNAAVSGTANRYKVHAGSGALQADAAVLAGAAVHNVLHAASGALVAGEAAMSGVAFIGDEPPVVSRLGGFEMGAPEIERKPLLQQILEARAARSAPVAKPAKKKAKAIEIQAARAVLADRGESQFTALMKQWAAQKPVLSPVVDTTAEAFMAQVKARILEIEQDDEDVLMLLLD